ncbi:MAG: helix-turn-helix domain-containing protein [Gammaproteobacteria bacterium]|nr:helix-turn-helix domain-containing protein [Gammaproteobacteria bacterium]
MIPTNLKRRFFSKVRFESDCWEWIGSRSSGYGMIGSGGALGPNVLAHRLSWKIHVGDIPDGLDILHSCDNRGCVNPRHLFPGTHADNMLDMCKKMRQRRSDGSPPFEPHQIREMREMKSKGLNQTEIGNAFGVTQGAISRIMSGKTYRWVPEGRSP